MYSHNNYAYTLVCKILWWLIYCATLLYSMFIWKYNNNNLSMRILIFNFHHIYTTYILISINHKQPLGLMKCFMWCSYKVRCDADAEDAKKYRTLNSTAMRHINEISFKTRGGDIAIYLLNFLSTCQFCRVLSLSLSLYLINTNPARSLTKHYFRRNRFLFWILSQHASFWLYLTL